LHQNNLSIVVIKYNEPINILEKCIESLIEQKKVNVEIIFLDQNPKESEKDVFDRYQILNYYVIPDISLSYARNYGMQKAKYEYIAYIDPDAYADRFWAYNIIQEFNSNKNVGIVGGKILPVFSKDLCWYHKAPFVMNMYSLLDLGPKSKNVNKVIGANFSINRKLLNKEKFREDLGRIDGKLLGGEETDFCERIRKKGYLIRYSPKAVVYHHISKERLKFRWLLKRFYYGGYSRAIRKGLPEPRIQDNKYSIFGFFILPIYLFFYFLGYFFGLLKLYFE